MDPNAPSGRQLELAHEDATVTIVEVGGGLRDYRVGDFAVLDGYPVDAMASRGRGQLLVPWPNRIAGGRYPWAGVTQQLAISEAKTGNAIHGLARWSAWELERVSPSSATSSFIVRAQSGYPFTVAFTAAYELGDDGLTVTMTATNLGAAAAPVGMGAHPYLYVPGADGVAVRADDARLSVPAERRLVVDDALIPTGDEKVSDGPFDFRSAREIGPLVIDHCFTGLSRDPDGRARVVLAGDGGTVTVWMDEAWEYVQVFTGDTLGPDERRRSVAVEPLTCPANAFNSGHGLRTLEPGETLTGTWGISPSL
jgi:aldose 1-epimerase